jgi:hypothetical protein
MSQRSPLVDMLVSGGQTGADRAALDVALHHGLPHGGWCPAGRRAEDGPLDGRYLLTETPSGDYEQRTEWNVRDTDGTVVFTSGPDATGGSLHTLQIARTLHKPLLHLTRETVQPVLELRRFIGAYDIRRLNVAGSREGTDPGIHAWVMHVLENALFPPDDRSVETASQGRG